MIMMKNYSDNNNNAVNTLGKLPDEQRQHVLSYLTCRDLMALTLVSKAVKNAALRSHTLINIDDDGGFGVEHSMAKASAMLRRTTINRRNMDPISSHPRQRRWTVSVDSTIGSNNNSNNSNNNNIDSSSNLINEEKLINLLQRFQSLRVLKLYNIDPTAEAEAFIPIINSCPAAASLVHIEFHDVRLIRNKYSLELPNNNHNLKHVVLSGTIFSSYDSGVLKSFVSSNNLQTLHLDGCRSLTDADVEDMNRIWSSKSDTSTSTCSSRQTKTATTSTTQQNQQQTLTTLSLENSSKLQKPCIKSTSLVKLDMSKCPILQDLSNIACPNLIDINLCHCPLINNESIQCLLSACPMIENLILSTCTSLTALSIKSKRMKKIDLNLCMKLTTANIHCEILEKLEVRVIFILFLEWA